MVDGAAAEHNGACGEPFPGTDCLFAELACLVEPVFSGFCVLARVWHANHDVPGAQQCSVCEELIPGTCDQCVAVDNVFDRDLGQFPVPDHGAVG